MRKTLISAFALAALSTGAFAQFVGEEVGSEFVDEQSILSETTFDLFNNEFDWAQEPATLAGLSGRRVWTQLGNVGGMDMFQIGAYGPLGEGNWAAFLRYSKDSYNWYEMDDDTYEYWEDTDGDLLSDYYESWMGEYWEHERERYFNLYLGYGWRLSDTLHLGFGFEHTSSDYSWDTQWAEVYTEESTLAGGEYLYNEWYDESSYENFDGDRNEFFFELKYMPSDTFSFRGRLFYNSEDQNDMYSYHWRYDEAYSDAGSWYEYSEWEDTYYDYSRDGHRWGIGLYFEHIVSDMFKHWVEIGWSNYSGNLNELPISNYYSEYYAENATSPDFYYEGFDVDYEFWANLENDADDDHFYFFYKASWELDRATLRAGLRYDDRGTDFDWAGTWDYEYYGYVNDGDNVFVDAGDEELWIGYEDIWTRNVRIDQTRWSIPVAIVMHLNDKWDLRAGAEYSHSTYKFTEDNWVAFNNGYDYWYANGAPTYIEGYVAPDEWYESTLEDWVYDPYNWLAPHQVKVSDSNVDWSLGVRYDHSANVEFELSLFEQGEGGSSDREGVDNTTIFAGVTLKWE